MKWTGEDTWNFPNCIGDLYRKHICVFRHKTSTSDYWNYFYSIVLTALVDAGYQFIFVDIGCQGRLSDCAVFRNCPFLFHLTGHYQTWNLKILLSLPCVIVADNAFPMQKHMKPYAQNQPTHGKLINYRFSWDPRTSENALGILPNVFPLSLHKLTWNQNWPSRLPLCAAFFTIFYGQCQPKHTHLKLSLAVLTNL